MSRIGRKPIPVPAGVTVAIEPEVVRVNGPRGELSERIHRDITVAQDGDELVVTRPTDRGEHRALHGLTRSLVANMVEGVTTGYQKTLEIQGVGYRAALKGRDLELALGYSHPVSIKAPDGIEFEVPQPTRVIVQGHLQAARGRDRRQHPQAAAAGALQGQGHPLRGRVRRPEGRQARMSRHHQAPAAAQAPPPRPREDHRHRRAAAHLGVPLQPRHLRAARRRRGRPHAGRRHLDRGRPALPRAHGAGREGRRALAERAKAAGVERAVFDRGGYQYHGRVKAFADGVREGGLAV